ncbi:hypothetical protein ACF0H5_010673 [Mactra antiquata]
MRSFIIVLWIAQGCVAPKATGPCGGDCALVDRTIANYEGILDHGTCHIFDHLDCRLLIKPDEHWVCCTNGQVFHSRCEYIQARCSVKGHDPNVLMVDHNKQCGPIPDHQQHPPEPCGPECHHIDEAIKNIAHFDEHICPPFEHVNCTQHVLPHEEQLCGTDGHTYNTHCEFVKARCKNFLSQQAIDPVHRTHILVQHPGQCITASTQTSILLTNSPSSQAPSSTHAPSTNQPTTLPYVTATSTHNLNTHTSTIAMLTAKPATTAAPITSTVAATTGSTGPISTTESMLNMLEAVLCSHYDQIDCTGTFDLMCGSDGQFYPNKCSFLKATCLNHGLTAVDKHNCSP